eukprot:4343989-Pleurochrysis_carterae.AAC.3
MLAASLPACLQNEGTEPLRRGDTERQSRSRLLSCRTFVDCLESTVVAAQVPRPRANCGQARRRARAYRDLASDALHLLHLLGRRAPYQPRFRLPPQARGAVEVAGQKLQRRIRRLPVRRFSQ